MRYLSNLPLRARSPSSTRPTDPLAIKRAQPTTCVLSLANVTVSMASTSNSTTPVAMEVDPLTVSVPLADTGNMGGVPFPSSKRTHSLLRATPSLSQCASECENSPPDSDSSEQDSLPDLDFDPPRKRTRTSALSFPSRPRTQRCSSAPSRVSVASVHLSGSVAPLPSQSAPSCINLMSMKSSSATPSSTWSRRRMMPGEMRMLLYLYRTLVYGLEVRRSNLPAACGDEGSETAATEAIATAASSTADSVADNSRLDVQAQDALLAQHLKIRLLASGAPPYMLVVDTEPVTQESCRKTSIPDPDEVDSGDMLIDDELSDSDTSLRLLHPHTPPSTTHTVLSYQQLVATLYIRQSLYPRRPSTKLSSKRSTPRRPGSKLSQSISLD